jgi:hypothetical protein
VELPQSFFLCWYAPHIVEGVELIFGEDAWISVQCLQLDCVVNLAASTDSQSPSIGWSKAQVEEVTRPP